MYDLNDTIVASCSGSAVSAKKIIRISGDRTFDILAAVVKSANLSRGRKVISSAVKITEELKVDASIYLFCGPASYTGEDSAEIHIFLCDEAVEKLIASLIAAGSRMAGPGEFTYRAYAHGKVDLSQAEAVAQIISSSNQYQLCAAQKLFAGTIERKVNQIRTDILELLSLVEAGLDFVGEDIEFITPQKAMESAEKIKNKLSALFSGAITFEQITELPSVVAVAVANAGKSSLVNSLTGAAESIVSNQGGTTRDCLGRWLALENCDCCLVDCAGIVNQPTGQIERLANIASARAIDEATTIIFCADISKENYQQDLQVFGGLKNPTVLCVATKCDLLEKSLLENKLGELKKIFGRKFFATSSKTLFGIEQLKELVEETVVSGSCKILETADKAGLTQRHKQLVLEAIDNIKSAAVEFGNNNNEMAALALRSAVMGLSAIDAEHIDEAILDNIFSQFCIGK